MKKSTAIAGIFSMLGVLTSCEEANYEEHFKDKISKGDVIISSIPCDKIKGYQWNKDSRAVHSMAWKPGALPLAICKPIEPSIEL